MAPEILYLRRRLNDFPVSVQFARGKRHVRHHTMINIQRTDNDPFGPDLAFRINHVMAQVGWACHAAEDYLSIGISRDKISAAARAEWQPNIVPA